MLVIFPLWYALFNDVDGGILAAAGLVCSLWHWQC